MRWKATMAKVKILAVIPNQTDATSFYRSGGPLLALKKSWEELDTFSVDRHNWFVHQMCDIVFLQRPYKKDHLDIVEMAKLNGKKVWVDFDDDLFNVPFSNPAYRIYGNDQSKFNIAKIISLADHVTVSTEPLKKLLQDPKAVLNKNVTVVPNAFDDNMLKRPEKVSRKKVVFWRGSQTHHQDLWCFQDEILDKRINGPKGWTWVFQGDKPWFLYEKLKESALFGDPIDIIEYFKILLPRVNPLVTIVPLYDTVFNRSKSNIAWIEGCYAGATCLVPRWEGWENPGAVTYSDVTDFGIKLKDMLAGHYDLEKMSEEGWQYIQDNLLLSKVNQLRKDVILSLL